MHIDIVGHHQFKITDAIKAYTTKRLAKLEHHFKKKDTEGHFFNDIKIHITFSIEKTEQKAVAHIRPLDIAAEASEKDLYAAIDKLVERLDGQIIQYKESWKEHRAK